MARARAARRAISSRNWDPLEHPRNPNNGKFVRKGSPEAAAWAKTPGVTQRRQARNQGRVAELHPDRKGGQDRWASLASDKMAPQTKPDPKELRKIYDQIDTKREQLSKIGDSQQSNTRGGSLNRRVKLQQEIADLERRANEMRGTPQTKPDSADKAINDAYAALARGEGASIDATELDGLLKRLTGGGDEAKKANLAHLDVGGYGTMFATDKTDALDRSKMPQLGASEEEMRPFLDLLRDRGVDVRIAELDPTTLKPSQSEISGAKTGKLAGFMARDGWLPGGLLVTSSDGYVVDGHHRWSGAAVVRASGARPDMTVTGLVVDRPIDEVLQLAMGVATFESLEFDRTAQ